MEILALAYMMENQYDSALIYYRRLESLDQGLRFPRYFGYALIQNGEVTKGLRFIEEDFTANQKRLGPEGGDPGSRFALAEIYAYRGEKEKAFEQLRTLVRLGGNNLERLSSLRTPLWDNIRNEPEFKSIFSEIEAHYQAEHERVKKWLEENE